MTKTPKSIEAEVDPKRGDALLKRMLQTKPKQHKEIVADRRKKASPNTKKGDAK